MIRDIYDIFLFLIISQVLAIVILFVNILLVSPKPDKEKVSAYECGFNPYENARGQFNINYYLVAILFIIFDLEITFLFPWTIVLGQLGIFGFWSMMIFILILTIGFFYEWKKGALNWE